MYNKLTYSVVYDHIKSYFTIYIILYYTCIGFVGTLLI